MGKRVTLASLVLVLSGAACVDSTARKYIDEQYVWTQKVAESICRLEVQANVPPAQRMCPGGPGDSAAQPPPPPKW